MPKRATHLHVILSDEEREALRAHAEALGVNSSTAIRLWVRSLATTTKKTTTTKKGAPDAK